MAVATKHNGGRTQGGACLGDLAIGHTFKSYGYINRLKEAQVFTETGSQNLLAPDTLDAQGYPMSLPGGVGALTILYIPSQADRPGSWVITGEGSGSLSVSSHTTDSGSLTASGGALRWVGVFSVTEVQFIIATTGGAYGHLKNLRLFHADDEERLDAGAKFTQDYLDYIAAIGHGELRFLDQIRANDSNVVKWSDRTPEDYIGCTDRSRAADYAGGTTNTGNAYSVTKTGWVLENGARLQVRWNATATADAITLSVNNGTTTYSNIPVLSVIGTAVLFSFGQYTNPAATRIGMLVYDAGCGGFLSYGGVDGPQAGIRGGMPYEDIIDLCAETGCHCWIPAPYLAASDPEQDWLRGLIQLFLARAPAWMKLTVETPNENWNAQFFFTNYAKRRAYLAWGVEDWPGWLGRCASLMGQAIADEAGAERDRIVFTVGVQTAGSDPIYMDQVLESTRYVDEDGGLAADPYIDALAPANYWHNYNINNYISSFRDGVEIPLALAYVGASTDAEREAIRDEYVGHAWTNGLPFFLSLFVLWAAYIISRDKLPRLYEGGPSWDMLENSPYDTGYGEEIDELRKAARFSPLLKYLAQWVADELLAAGYDAPTQFGSVGDTVWSCTIPDLYGERTALFEQIANFNKRRRTLRLEL